MIVLRYLVMFLAGIGLSGATFAGLIAPIRTLGWPLGFPVDVGIGSLWGVPLGMLIFEFLNRDKLEKQE